MAIQDDWTIDYTNKTLTYTGGFTGGIPDSKYRVNELYTWLQDTFDEPGQMDDPVPMSAQTPKEYKLINGWFMDNESSKALYEGAIATDGWNRVEGTTVGIVQVRYTTFTAQPVPSDIGKAIAHNPDADSGVLVAYDNTRQILWIRPDDDTVGNSFNSTSGDVEIATGTCDVDQDVIAYWGEAQWIDIYTLGTIQTEIYIVQVNDFAEVTTPGYTKLSAWWAEDIDFSAADGVEVGHVDLLIKVKEAGSVVDSGKLVVLVRQYGKTFSHFEITITSGRGAVPLSSGSDLDNTTGHRQFLTSAATGSWSAADVGVIIREDGAGNERNKAIITALTGTTPNFTVQYYLIGTQVDFSALDIVETEDEAKNLTLTAAAPTDVGPAADTSIDLTFGGTLGDIDEDAVNEYYSITVDCNSQGLDEVYERMKYLTRRGETGDIDQGGQTIIGEWYRGIGEQYVPYDTGSQDNPFTEGEEITWAGGGVGYLTSKHDRGASEGFLILRRLRGAALVDGTTMTGTTSTHTADVDEDGGADPLATITPVTAAPIGTFAGGKFFFARGVKPINVAGGDASNYQCIDSEGNVVNPPVKVSIYVTGLKDGDRAVIFEVDTAGDIDITKDQHGLAAGNDEFDTDIVVDSAIPADTPGKTTGGVIRGVDISLDEETRYRFTSWTGSTFTLSTGITGAADAGGSSTRLVDAVVDFEAGDIEVGDSIYNSTDGEYATVVKIVDADNIDTTPLPTGSWDNGDGYQSNQLDRSYNGAEDTAYVPFIDVVRISDGDSSSTIVYGTPITCVARVRFSSDTGKILPFESTNISVGSGGLSVAAIRTTDPIAS